MNTYMQESQNEKSQIQKTVYCKIAFKEALELAKLISSKRKQITVSIGKGRGMVRLTTGGTKELSGVIYSIA